MLIRRSTLDAIRRGDVTLAFRRWKRPTVRTGGMLTTAVGVLEIELVERVDEDDISKEDARRSGHTSREDLLGALRHRDGDLYRITLRYQGEDPRIRLRNDDRLDEDELDEIERTLQAMDSRSSTGRWTLETLAVIRDNPKVHAIELAKVLGLEKDPFKRNVRKLKSLGLTVSHSPGYTLSRRGEVVLDHLIGG